MSPTPRVSVIIATYNRAAVLRYAIKTVLWQTLHDFELLVIGDGCTDDSASVVAAFDDPRITWHNLPSNSGSAAIPNATGVSMARGKYIAYLGHDDLWHPAHLETLTSALESSGAAVGFALCAYYGAPETPIRQLRGAMIDGGVPKSFPSPITAMHRRDLIDKTGTWRDYTETDAPPFTDLMQRAQAQGARFVSTHRLTAFKFPAIWRKNVYLDNPFDEQAALFQRMQTEPDFIERELTTIAEAYALGLTEPESGLKGVKRPKHAPKGWKIEMLRRYRGLDARELPAEQSAPRAWWRRLLDGGR